MRIKVNKTAKNKKIYANKLLFLFVVLFYSFNALAQHNLSGTVKDQNGQPLPGTNVLEKGTTNGTQTDFDGKFILNVTDKNATLTVSYLGFVTKEVAVNGVNTISVVLQEDTTTLDDVVVVAYGTTKKRDVTGSISTIKADDIQSGGLAGGSALQGLQGKASGLQISANGGVGTGVQVKVRGISSLSSGTNPLFIIDGVAGVGIDAINPNDIASIQVLKDASATAIYGARGSNGVILVTTKQGTSSEAQFNLSVSSGVSNWTNNDVGYANTETYFKIMDEGYANSGATFDPQLEVITPRWQNFTPVTREEALATDNNWADLLTQTGSFQDVNFSSSQRTENSNIYGSVWYRNDKGNLLNSDFSQLTGRLNMTFNKGALEYGLRIFGRSTDRNTNSSWSRVYWPTWIQAYDENNASGYWNGNTGNNPLALADASLNRNNQKGLTVSGSIFAKLDIKAIDGLSVRAEYSPSIGVSQGVFWQSSALRPTGDILGNSGSESKNTSRNELFNMVSTFDRDFGKHNFNLVVGHERQSSSTHRMSVGGDNLIGTFQEVNVPGSNVTAEAYIDPLSESKRMSYFSRLNYKFNNKYLLGGSFTREGYSQFNPENRWGNFYSVSAGWILSEDFFADSNAISLLKLRGSYGETGNGNIPGGITESRFSLNTGRRLYQQSPSLNASVLGNADATWETLNNLDVGLDYSLFKNRVNGSVAYYRQEVLSLLLQVTLPASTGLGNTNGDFGNNSIWGNVGDLVNDGIEFDISAQVIDKKDFSWSVGFNITTNRNEVTSISPDIDASGDGIRDTYTFTKKGLPIGTYFMAHDAGVDPQRGIPMIREIDADLLESDGIYQFTGNIIPASENNSVRNRAPVGDKSALPKWFGGLSNTITYKNIDFGFNVTFQGGNYIYNLAKMQTSSGSPIFAVNADILANSWRQPGDIAEYPQLVRNSFYPYDDEGNPGTGQTFIGNSGYNTKYLEKADFVRLRNVTLGYTLPKRILNKVWINNARVYVTATNLFTITDFNGYDPEQILEGGNLGGIINNGNELPQSRIISMGLDLKF